MILNEAKEVWVFDPVRQKHVQPKAIYLGDKLVWRPKQQDFSIVDMSICAVLSASRKYFPNLDLIRTTIRLY